MTLREIFDALRRHRLLLLGMMIAALIVGGLLVIAQGTRYTSEVQVALFQPQVVEPGANGQSTQEKLVLQVVTLARAVSTPDFVADAAHEAKIDPGDASISGDAPINTTIVHMEVSSSSKARAANVAQAAVNHLQRNFETQQASSPADQRITVTQIQRPTTRRSSVNPAFTLLAALVAGLAIGVTVVLLLDE